MPLLVFGLPAVLWQAGHRRWAGSRQVPIAWLLAVAPVVGITQVIG